ncbi:MAG: hypothetical protein ABSA47_01005 [Verrucomicrobiota bacterium]|jgi:hypothetical protein
MKRLLRIQLSVLAGLLLWGATGCSNREVDTVKLKSAFQSADQATREKMDEGIADITASNYSAALPVFEKVAYGSKLTKDQRLILVDSIKKLQAKVK